MVEGQIGSQPVRGSSRRSSRRHRRRSQGSARDIADRFAAEGARVAILDRLVDEAAALADDNRRLCRRMRPGRRRRQRPRRRRSAIDQLGGIDVLVNNAGIFTITPLLDITADDWDAIFAVNVRAMLLTTQVAARAMIAQGDGGKIVNMASMGGKVGAAGQAHYAASKAAVISLTQVAATELGPHGITVNCDLPRLRAHRDGRRHPHPGDGRRVVGEVPARPPRRPGRRGHRWPCSWRPTTPTTAPARR